MTIDYILKGLAAFLLIAGLAWYFRNASPARQRKAGEEPRISAAAFDAQKDMAVVNTAEKRDAGRNPNYIVTPDIAKRKTALEPIRAGSGQTDLRRAINNLDSLPAMPVIAQKLLALKMDTDEG